MIRQSGRRGREDDRECHRSVKEEHAVTIATYLRMSGMLPASLCTVYGVEQRGWTMLRSNFDWRNSAGIRGAVGEVSNEEKRG